MRYNNRVIRYYSTTAPPGCLQYFIGSVGVIKSFNFFFDAGSTTSARQLSNQDYTICIRQEAVSPHQIIPDQQLTRFIQFNYINVTLFN